MGIKEEERKKNNILQIIKLREKPKLPGEGNRTRVHRVGSVNSCYRAKNFLIINLLFSTIYI